MASILTKKLPTTISDLIDDRIYGDFYSWQSERIVGYGRTAERFARINDAAEYGADGSTHGEHIEDFREWKDEVFSELRREAFRLDIPEEAYAALEASIDAADEACS